MNIIIAVCWVLAMGEPVLAQLSDFRHSRVPLSGLSDTSQVGISVDMGLAPHLMTSASIIQSLQPRLETLGYRVALAPTHPPDGLWLHVDCEAILEKKSFSPTTASQRPLGKARSIAPPCQLAYRFHQEVIPWKNVDRLIYSESVATMQQIAQIATPLKPEECVKRFFHLYDFPVLLAAE